MESSGAGRFADQRSVKFVDQFLGLFSGFVEQADIGRVTDVGRRTGGIDNQLASILWMIRDIIIRQRRRLPGLDRYQPRQHDPAIVGIQMAGERKIKIRKLKLPTTV